MWTYCNVWVMKELEDYESCKMVQEDTQQGRKKLCPKGGQKRCVIVCVTQNMLKPGHFYENFEV